MTRPAPDIKELVLDLLTEGEENPEVTLVHKDEDTIILWLAGITVTCHPDEVKPNKLLRVLFLLEDLYRGKEKPVLVQVLDDGMRIDGKFVCERYYPALYKGIKLSQLSLLGHMYN